jgi:hypothetical protein
MKKMLFFILCSLMFVFGIFSAQAGIYDFKGGVRIPAASCVTYSDVNKHGIVSSSGGFSVYNYSGSIDVSFVCQVPVPEKVLVRQFVMVGNVNKGLIRAELGAVRWNAPRQHLAYASVKMVPTTAYEIPAMKQKKVVHNLPVSGNKSLRTDRGQTYFIEVHCNSNTAVSIEDALEVFYFELYWD